MAGLVVAGCATSAATSGPVPDETASSSPTSNGTGAARTDDATDAADQVAALCQPVAQQVADLAAAIRSDAGLVEVDRLEATVSRCVAATGRAHRAATRDEGGSSAGQQIVEVRRVMREVEASLAMLERERPDRDRAADTDEEPQGAFTWRDMAALAEEIRTQVDGLA